MTSVGEGGGAAADAFGDEACHCYAAGSLVGQGAQLLLEDDIAKPLAARPFLRTDKVKVTLPHRIAVCIQNVADVAVPYSQVPMVLSPGDKLNLRIDLATKRPIVSTVMTQTSTNQYTQALRDEYYIYGYRWRRLMVSAGRLHNTIKCDIGALRAVDASDASTLAQQTREALLKGHTLLKSFTTTNIKQR